MTGQAYDQKMRRRLEGRRIVVTGAASGIGRRVAKVFVAEGARVALFDLNAEGLSHVAAETGGLSCPVNITDEEATQAIAAKAAEALGGIDGIVNAAGIMPTGSMADTSADLFRKVIDVNLTGTYIVVRACLSFLKQSPLASVVNIASAQGLLPNAPGHTAYAASKGGVVNLTRAMASDLAPMIRVNCVAPGMVDTPMADGFRANVGNYALKRLADPEEIANAILFLISSDASFVTGATLAVDGGRSFH